MSFTRGSVDKKLVTGIAYMDTRDINPNVIDVNRDGGFDDLMLLMDRYKVTVQPDYHHFVNQDVLEVLVIDAGGVTGSGTATLTVTVTTTGFARRGQKFIFPNGEVGMINSAVTTAASKDSFTITSVTGGNLTAVAGNKMAPIGITVGEKSGEVDALTYQQTKYFNQLETFRDKTSITDIQISSTVEVGDGYYAQTQSIEQAKSFKLQMSAAFIAGKKSVNTYGTASPTLLDENGNSVQTTGGFTNEIIAYGVNTTVATPGTVVNADIDTLCDALNAVKAPGSYLVLSPDKAWRTYDNYFKNLGSSGVTSAHLNVDGKDFDFNVSTFQKGKYDFKFGPLAALDHPQLFNFTGSSAVGKSTYGIPTGKVKTTTSNGEGGNNPYIGIRYFANQNAGKNMGTAYVMETMRGRLAPVPQGDENALIVDISAQQGVECLGTRQMFKQIVLA